MHGCALRLSWARGMYIRPARIPRRIAGRGTGKTEGSGLYFIAFNGLPQRSVERSGLDLITNLPGGRAMTTG